MGFELTSLTKFFTKTIPLAPKPIKLNFKKISSPHYAPKLLFPPLVIIHGLMGSSRTFSHVAHSKRIRMNRDCYLIDMRNHGNSEHTVDLTYNLMKTDVIGFLNEHSIKECDILGFSMGGKIGMTTALDPAFDAKTRIRKLIVVDVAPVKQEYYDGTSEIMNILLQLDLTQMKNRNQVEKHFENEIPSQKMRRFLMTNLEVDGSKLYWKCNLDGIANHFRDILDFEKQSTHFDNPTLFIRGENSHAVNSKNIPIIRSYFPNCTIETIKGCGHWIHMDQPEEFIEHVSDFINK
jgi:pimeloyl-ACP methyl ester carboxylesterase